MTGIARYFAEVGVSVNNSQLRKVDLYLQALETKFTKYRKKFDNLNVGITKFSVNETKLKQVLGNALDSASKTLVFDVSRFAVNERSLQAALLRASRSVGRKGSLGTSLVGGQLSSKEWDRRQRETTNEWNRRRIVMQEEARMRRESANVRSTSSRLSRRDAMAGGGVAGSAARLYAPALALGLGGYGLSQLNERNQQIVASQLTTQAVVEQAGGSRQQGVQSYDWLRAQANRVGFSYLDAAPDFNKLLSGVTGAGMSVDQGKGIFKGFSELARVNHVDKASQNRIFRALSQVAGKDKLMSEELECRLAS